MRKVDIRAYKNSLRDKAKAMRRGMDPEEKAQMDRADHRPDLFAVPVPGGADTAVLCFQAHRSGYHSTDSRALADGKQVACPRCVEGTRQMEFYRIHSLDDLEKRTFGVLEPKVPGV